MELTQCFSSLYSLYRNMSGDRAYDGSSLKKIIIRLLEETADKETDRYLKDNDFFNLAILFLNEPYEFLGRNDKYYSEDHSFDDEKKGISYLMKCSDKETGAYGALGCYYALGLHLSKDEEKAKALLEKTKIFTDYYVRIGDYLLNKESVQAFHFYCLGEENGKLKSAFMKGYCELMGLGTPKDEKAGFEQIASANFVYDPDASCCYWMAYCYLKGIGTEIDEMKAKHCYKIYMETQTRVNDLTMNDPMGLIGHFEYGRLAYN